MADPGPNPAELEERIAGVADALDRLIGVVSKLDDETLDLAEGVGRRERRLVQLRSAQRGRFSSTATYPA